MHPKDVPRFAMIGVIASMQPVHAVADRELVDKYWPRVVTQSYAWGALARAGAMLAFGSDAPVETADPLLGIDAATAWRRRAAWHPELAISRAKALRAYTVNAAFAVGMEQRLGSLRLGKLCDMTVVGVDGVEATIVGGKVSWRRSASLSALAAVSRQVLVDDLHLAEHGMKLVSPFHRGAPRRGGRGRACPRRRRGRCSRRR